MTVRQVYYLATVRGLVDKTDTGYRDVLNNLIRMRRADALPYAWLVDNTRRMLKPYTVASIIDALDDTVKAYRKALWTDADDYVEIWIEKDALSGVVYPVTHRYDVPLMPARGYASRSFLYSASEEIARQDRPTFIYHFGDHDPSGVNAGEKIEETLQEMAPDSEIVFERLAVQPWQIEQWNLPTRPTKPSDTRSRGFGSISVELDAIDPERLRLLVRQAIEKHLPRRQFEILKAAEQSERNIIRQLVRGAVNGGCT
jgi:hypothetical protein